MQISKSVLSYTRLRALAGQCSGAKLPAAMFFAFGSPVSHIGSRIARRGATARCPRPCMSVKPDFTDVACVLSHDEARALLPLRGRAASKPETTAETYSIDLGRRRCKLFMSSTGVHLSKDGCTFATWKELQSMSKSGRVGAFQCYLDDSPPQRIAAMSVCSRPASLRPIEHAPPTLMLGGFGMHRFSGTDPARDTAAKIAAAGVRGCVLDICTGLGYTAIAAAKNENVCSVTTIELDPAVIEIQSMNPWSRELFTDSKISCIVGDATEVLCTLPDATFDTVLHDPPAQALAGDLYSAEFYVQLRRVCTKGATLFHYIGNPRSTASGRLFRGVQRRLEEAGFHRVTIAEHAFGVTAIAGVR